MERKSIMTQYLSRNFTCFCHLKHNQCDCWIGCIRSLDARIMEGWSLYSVYILETKRLGDSILSLRRELLASPL